MDVLNSYHDWLRAQSDAAAGQWYKRVTSSKLPDRQGAESEAKVWQYLSAIDPDLRAFDKPGTGGPDFGVQVASQSVRVEVTTLIDSTVRDATGIASVDGCDEPVNVGSLRRKVLSKLKSKSGSRQVGGACIVWICVPEPMASTVLVGDDLLEECVLGEGESYAVDQGSFRRKISVKDGAFLCLNADGILNPRRQHISALVVSGSAEQVSARSSWGAINEHASAPIASPESLGIPWLISSIRDSEREVLFGWSKGTTT
ncbi:MAG: hypothetical protein ACTS22_02450 [Phycisphaerales bacterium]